MKKFKTYLLAAAGIGIVSLTLSLTNAGRVLAESMKPLLVTVVNDSNAPVPVRDIDNPARQPFQMIGPISIADGEAAGRGSIAVPSGKRLVIEYVSVLILLPAGQKPTQVSVITTLNEIGVDHQFGATLLGTNLGGADTFIGSQQTRLYSDPGTGSVGFFFQRNANSGPSLVEFEISGYLVDLQ